MLPSPAVRSVCRYELALCLLALCASTCSIALRHRAHRRPAMTASLFDPTIAAASREHPPDEARDADGDGIDDATELSLAQSYFPYFSIDPDDRCSRHGVLFRVTPNPDDPTEIAIWYVILFEHDCGVRQLGGL